MKRYIRNRIFNATTCLAAMVTASASWAHPVHESATASSGPLHGMVHAVAGAPALVTGASAVLVTLWVIFRFGIRGSRMKVPETGLTRE